MAGRKNNMLVDAAAFSSVIFGVWTPRKMFSSIQSRLVTRGVKTSNFLPNIFTGHRMDLQRGMISYAEYIERNQTFATD